jgi:hypothetical protein
MEVGAMPKTSARKKSSAARNRQRVAAAASENITVTSGAGLSGQAQARPAGTTSIMSLLMPGMVALGCWGMAFTFTVFSTDPNRLLFGAMAALMALMWSVNFGIRARKVLRQK